MHCSGRWGELILIQGAEFVKHSMFLQSLMHWQFCKQLQHENNERGRTQGGDWTSDWLQDIEPNGNQRAGDARAATDLYLTCSSGDLPHERGEQKAQGGRRKYGQQVRGQTLREGERRKRLEGGERETEEPESAATSAGSYLHQPFFHSGRSWTPASVHLPPACWSAMGGLLFFFSSLVLRHISSSYPEAEEVTQQK